MKFFFSAICALFVILSGCGKIKGEFAFKTFGREVSRKIDGPLEFEKNKTINWVYIFHKIKGVHKVGVVLMKKELVWVDINDRIESISMNRNIIYGNIEDLSDGAYKILITEDNAIIDQREFLIFTGKDDYYKYDQH